jgi:hypothetical protein
VERRRKAPQMNADKGIDKAKTEAELRMKQEPK